MATVGALSVPDAVALARALRPPEKGGTAPAAVDLWVSGERTGMTMFAGLALICWGMFAVMVRNALKKRDR
jgi:hypothetical protein